ncbi:unnamed protein product [Brassica oleracea]
MKSPKEMIETPKRTIPSTTSFHVTEECYMKKQGIKISLKILRICFSPILR